MSDKQCANETCLINSSLMCIGCLENVCTSVQFPTVDREGIGRRLRQELQRQAAARRMLIDKLDEELARIDVLQRAAAAAAERQLAHVGLTTLSATAIETANRCWMWSSKLVDRMGFNIRVSNGGLTAQKPITDDDDIRFSQAC
eukprot:TRINITY_DN524_c0_g2_i1.p5 TRINITY_DN524_c0_g2~~TRINITY_DN524_c0_g2_i1.p5  ORF type:complete len:144 (-),score=32.44 TRINITY_DN524_c0_g2_i1:105-536(-)